MKLAHAKHKLDYPMEKKRVREAAPRGAPYWGRKLERQAGVWLQWGLWARQTVCILLKVQREEKFKKRNDRIGFAFYKGSF